MKKLFFFDIDHTLYNNEQKVIPNQTKKLLYQLSQNPNNILGIATGRSYRGLEILKELKQLFQYFVIFNGAITLKKETIIQSAPIPQEDVLQINKKAFERQITIINCEFLQKGFLFQIDPDTKEFIVNQATKNKIQHTQQLTLNKPIYKINLFHSNIEKIVTLLKEFRQFHSYFWKNGIVSLSANKVHKAYGISPIQKMYPNHQLICIGDGCNDEEMFQAANLSIVMKNTKYDYLKKIANLVAPDIQDDILFDFFKKNNLI